MSKLFLYKDSSHIGLGPTLMISFTLIISLKALSPIQSRSEVLRVRTSTSEFGGHNLALNSAAEMNCYCLAE